MKTKIIPVIHYLNNNLAIEQAMIANSFGVDGVFLISHNGRDKNLGPLGIEIKNLLPHLKVGINMLSRDIMYCAQIVKHFNLDMIWGDNCGVSSQNPTNVAIQLSNWKKENPYYDIFASVAFKYQHKEMNIAKAAMNAKELGFIPTTSGERTGVPPTLDKIKTMSEAVGGELAVASGMNAENVNFFKDYLSHILVSTGISKDDYTFDIDLLSQFVNKVREK